MDILKFIVAGNVDDGKSTLIGRLLYDSKSILTDQLEDVRKSKNNGNGEINFAFLTDGLRAEREQGITIDVAYKYFNTPKRKFIIADTPGHFQYTRNMVTGASNSDLAIILIDARNGINEQTKRHSIISSLLGISHLVVCVNKMDLVDYSKEVFRNIKDSFTIFFSKLHIKNIQFIPISALLGDNVVEKSGRMHWYNGRSLLNYLEEVQINTSHNSFSRFPVQWVIRPRNGKPYNYRGYAGKITSGNFKNGDRIVSLPSGFKTTIKNIEQFGNEIEEAFAPMSVVFHTTDDLDIRRGDLIVKEENLPSISRSIEAVVCWMDTKPLEEGNKYLIQHNNKTIKCIVKEIIHKIDVNNLDEIRNADSINLNDICRVHLITAEPLCYDDYKKNKSNGNFILVDEFSNTTAGAGMIG